GEAVAALGVAEVRIASVDEDVAGLEQADELLECPLGGVSGRDHHPRDPRRVEGVHELLERGHGPRGIGARVRLDLVPALAQAPDHVAAHASEPDDPELHAPTSSPRLARMPSSSSPNESENFSTPSSSSVATTSS